MTTREDKEYYEKLWNEIKFCGCGTQFCAAVVICIILCFCSCATKNKVDYTDKEVVKYQKEFVHDTLIQHTHDSIYHTIFQKGDTVYSTKYVEKTRWRDRVVVKTDTCYRDSVRTQIKETVVEKQKIPKWCYYCLVGCVLFIIFAFIKLVRWLQIH
jgi:hypothetical protein